MASETTTVTAVTEYDKGATPPPPLPKSNCKCSVWDAFLRVLLLAASVVAVVLMVTSKETKLVQVQLPGMPVPAMVPKPAKFNYSPAFIYLVAALSVAGLYSIITGLASTSVVWKPYISPKWPLILILTDVLILGLVASATGTAGGVTYIGLKGNSHVNWNKICDTYGKFCRYVGTSVVVSLFASFVLVLLIVRNAHSLYRSVEPKS